MQIKSLIALTLCSVALSGCSTRNAAVEAKRQYAIEHMRQTYLKSSGPIFRRFGTDIFSVLSSATTTSLKVPQFASAAMGRDDGGEYRLYLYWVESAPSIDGVELFLGRTNHTVAIAVSKENVEENIKASDVSVVMHASWIWSRSDSIRSKLENIEDVSELKVRLLRSGKPETGWCPVAFYRLDKWMGSKEIIEMSTGNPAKKR